MKSSDCEIDISAAVCVHDCQLSTDIEPSVEWKRMRRPPVVARRPQLRLVRDARDEALHLRPPGSGGDSAVRRAIERAAWRVVVGRVCRACVFRDPVHPCT